jgi:hypothetical protein
MTSTILNAIAIACYQKNKGRNAPLVLQQFPNKQKKVKGVARQHL